LHLALILGEIGLGLGDGRFDQAGIDGEQQVALLDVLPLLDMHPLQFTAHLGLHRHDGGSLDGSDGLDLEWNGFLLDLGHRDRHRATPLGLLGLGLLAGAGGGPRTRPSTTHSPSR
jgi:hypothetical protein